MPQAGGSSVSDLFSAYFNNPPSSYFRFSPPPLYDTADVRTRPPIYYVTVQQE